MRKERGVRSREGVGSFSHLYRESPVGEGGKVRLPSGRGRKEGVDYNPSQPRGGERVEKGYCINALLKPLLKKKGESLSFEGGDVRRGRFTKKKGRED